MSKKEYGKGFTLEDLEAQRQAKWALRGQLGLAASTPPASVGKAAPGGFAPPWKTVEIDGKDYYAFEGTVRPSAGEAVMPASDVMARGQRAIASMLESVNALGLDVASWPKPYMPGDPVPETQGKAVGYFGGLPVFEEAQARGPVFEEAQARGYSFAPAGDGFRTVQVGWVKSEPPPEQPTGRFQNLDFEL